ncbi:Conserved_hypothetical protein [Hexamita inflata]|uniref:Uncharacterized protein n=1 Tax=Hexamita inflata TaxID=28002 RepID=A0ABP1GH18_9EUKA
MLIRRDFQPQSFTELITDYAYIFHDDDVTNASRKTLKLKLFQAYVPRVYQSDLPLLLIEAAGQPLRSIFVIYHPSTQLKQSDKDLYSQLDVSFTSDDDVTRLLNQLEDSTAKQRQSLHKVLSQMTDIYAHRVKMRQTQLAQNYFDIHQLPNYLQPPEQTEEQESIAQINPQLAQQILACSKQLNQQQQDCVKNTYYQNVITTLKQQLNLCNSQQFAFSQQTVQVTVQDFNFFYSPRNLETLDLKVSVNCNFPLQFTSTNQLNYDVIQNQFPLCDDPTKTWFYVNDTRVTYAHPLDSVPYGRLLMLGNSLKQPSCVLQDKLLVEGAEELASEYQHFETVIAKTCHALAQLLVSATKHSKKAATIIHDEIKQLSKSQITPEEFKYQPSDFQVLQTTPEQALQNQVDDFIIQNNQVLQMLRFDPKLLPGYNEYLAYRNNPTLTPEQQFNKTLFEKLQVPKNATNSKNWLVDFDEMFVLDRSCNYQSPVSLYTQEKVNPKPEDDLIIIKPKFSSTNYNLYVCKTGRMRTTYDTVCLLAQFLSLVGHVDPLPRRTLTHVLIFNEKLGMKNLFVPLEIMEAAEQEHKALVYSNKITASKDQSTNSFLYDLVVEKIAQISSRDKFAKVKVAEDYNAGECNVCNTRFESYKHHICSPEHVRNFRAMMLQGENMIMALIHHQNNFELIQAINTQFNAIACTLASELNCSWHQACNAINSAIKSIGGSYQLDTEDAPRSNSPNCKTNSFARWREDVCLRRQGVLESVLTSSAARKSGYKRIKSAAASFAIVGLSVERSRRLSVEGYLRGLMVDVVEVSTKKATNQLEKEKLEKQKHDRRLQQYNLKVVVSSELLNYCYYKYPADVPHPEVCFIRVKPVDAKLFQFHEEGHKVLIQVAFTTLLIRAACGKPLTAESLIQNTSDQDVSEMTIEEDAYLREVVERLTDTYPQLDGEMYKRETIKLIEQRQLMYGHAKAMAKDPPLDVLKLDTKQLRSELSDMEIGLIPQTDVIIMLAKVLMQIQLGHKITTNELYQQAIQLFISNSLPVMSKHLIDPIKQYLETSQIVDIDSLIAPKEGEDEKTALDPNQAKVKLPGFNIFDPLIQKNKQQMENTLNKPKVIVNPKQLQSAQNCLRMIQSCPKQILQKIFTDTAKQLDVPLQGCLFDQTSDFIGSSPLLQVETENQFVNNNSKYEPTFEVPYQPVQDERSSSALGRLRNITKRVQVPRANSICSRAARLEDDQISSILLQDDFDPFLSSKFAQGNLATVGQRELNSGFNYNNKIYKKYQSICQSNQNENQESAHLIIKQKQVISAPILSTNLSEPFYRQFLQNQPWEMTAAQQKEFSSNLIPILNSQANACYSALATVYGGFADNIDITVQFWKASADALLGTSASVSSVTSDTPAYGLKTADVASCTLVALAARAKLLQDKATAGLREVPLQSQSKTIARQQPMEGLGGDLNLNLEANDVQIVRNNKVCGGEMDILLGGIYGLNGGEG